LPRRPLQPRPLHANPYLMQRGNMTGESLLWN